MGVQVPLIRNRHNQILCHGNLVNVRAARWCRADSWDCNRGGHPPRREAELARRPGNSCGVLPRICKTAGGKPVDDRGAGERSPTICGVVSGYQLIEISCSASQNQTVAARRLPGKSNARSKVVPRRSVDRNAVDVVFKRPCGSGRCSWQAQQNQRGCIRSLRRQFQSTPAHDASRSRHRHGTDQAWPEVAEIPILLGAIPVIFPAEPEVHCQPRVDLEVILDITVEVINSPIIWNQIAVGEGTSVT